MDKIIIKGGNKLQGEVPISGSKNAILPLMFSSLLVEGKHVFHNVPDLKDVETSCILLEYLGCLIERNQNTLIIHHRKLKTCKAPYELVRQMRASVLSLGPLLARYGWAQVSLPGGCAIGTRAVHWHLRGLKLLGACIEIQNGQIVGKAKSLKANRLLMDFPSVGATENLMMAASLASGTTVIENAAREPEIVDLAGYLKMMGVHIEGAGTHCITITSNNCLKPGEYHVMPDRIEAGTFLLAGAITKGDICVTNCLPNHLSALLLKLKSAGFNIDVQGDVISLSTSGVISSVDIVTAPYPGFPTDLQAQFMALLTQTHGIGLVKETIFENRFMHVQELARLGADICLTGFTARVKKSSLQGAPVTATDLRASACLILACLVAQGESTVHRVYHLDRGYEHLEKKLAHLGANIKRR